MTDRWVLLADPIEDGSRRVRGYLLTEGEPTFDQKMTLAWASSIYRGYPTWDDVPEEERPEGGFGGEWVLVAPEDVETYGLIGDDWTYTPEDGVWHPPEWVRP